MGGTVRSPLSSYSPRSDRGILRLCWYVYFTATFVYIVIDLATSSQYLCVASKATLSKPNLLFSLKWVEAPGHGDGGPNWVEVCYKHDSGAGG